MTTTHLYSGIDDGQKPSSRVLNPPGGKSNNIFGGAEEPSPPKMREQAPKQVTIMDQNQNSGGASEPPRQVQQTQGQQANPSRKVSYNPITGEEYPEDYGQKNKTEKCEEEDEEEESIEVKKEENTSSNAVATATTVTAASNEPHLGAPKKTAVKVRQPPGGASSGLW